MSHDLLYISRETDRDRQTVCPHCCGVYSMDMMRVRKRRKRTRGEEEEEEVYEKKKKKGPQVLDTSDLHGSGTDLS